MMRKTIAVALAGVAVAVAGAAHAGSVNGYVRSNGTYVQGYQRSAPDYTATDNYSFKDNANPYTGQVGTDYYRHNPTSPYYNGSGQD